MTEERGKSGGWLDEPGLEALRTVVEVLRGPQGCPWDQAQDLASLRPYLLEESYELLEAIDRAASLEAGAADGSLREELGDLLFVLLLIGQVCSDAGRFDIHDAARDSARKMIDRHPHVFGGEGPTDPVREDAPVDAAWERRKSRDRPLLEGVPRSLPALLRAHRQGEKTAAVGFDWTDAEGALAKVHEELAELEAAMAQQGGQEAIRAELGDLLMATASLGRHMGIPAEAALRDANERFSRRFGTMEAEARRRGLVLADLGEAELDELWEWAKTMLGNPERTA
ncbi:MAG: nucleoside triphosphate pyrophosphohydrolase [Myxococcota bacterium]|nr:nucleoside triphosphate pyrophosphohydrolase [Myxococcota bacterium]